jgi:IclR family KDG regulon transcriptional repressor
MTENISRTVSKALDILEIFLQKDGEISLTELSRLTGCDKSTVYRLASTLEKRRFLYQHRKNGKYCLGLKMIDCSFAIRRNLRFIDLGYLYLGKLNAAENAAVNLTIIDADKSLTVEEVGISSKGLPAGITPLPKRLPLHATACGKVLLAYMPEEERRLFYGRNTLKAFTPQTITDVSCLEEELETVRKEGVAYDMEDYKPGLWAVAVPLYNSRGKIIASASVIVPAGRTDPGSIKHLVDALKDCGRDLSQAIIRLG